MGDTVRVGLVGTSWWAEAMYLPALADHPIGRISALCGRDLDRARGVAASWSIPHVYDDWSAMLASNEVDAVIIATPNETHFEITMGALDRGFPVLCEKPLGMDVAEKLIDGNGGRGTQCDHRSPVHLSRCRRTGTSSS
jgi:predicted dehydrogenase